MAKKEKAVEPTAEKATKKTAKAVEPTAEKATKAKAENSIDEKGKEKQELKTKKAGFGDKDTFVVEKDEKEKNVKMSSTTSGEQKTEFKNDKAKSKSENLDYLLDKLKYLGFPKNDYVKQKVQDIMNSGKGGEFKHHAKNDATIGSNSVTFDVKINHSEKNDKFYFGGYDAKLTNANKGVERSLSMTSSNNTYTAKEAINLLEGRMVKREFENKAKGFVGLDFNSPKNEYGNHKLNIITQKDKLDVLKVVKNSAIVLSENPKFSKEKLQEFLTKSLEKGNMVKSQIDTKDGVKDGFVRYDAFKGDLKYHDDKMKSIADDRLNISAEKSEDKQIGKEETQSSSLKR